MGIPITTEKGGFLSHRVTCVKGILWSDIARRFGRSRDAVAARLARLGVAAEEPRGLQTRAIEKAGAE